MWLALRTVVISGGTSKNVRGGELGEKTWKDCFLFGNQTIVTSPAMRGAVRNEQRAGRGGVRDYPNPLLFADVATN